MKENLVPQEQSLVLKELGFDKKCWGVWVNGRFEPRYKSKNSTFNPCLKLDKRNVDYCTAPTFEQAFDFFRKEYNLFVNIDITNWGFYFFNIVNTNELKEVYNSEEFETYEEMAESIVEELIQQSNN